MFLKILNFNEEKVKKNDFFWKIIFNCEMEIVRRCKFKYKSMRVNLEIKY